MKLAINLALSVIMLAVCLYFVWPDHDQIVKLRGVVDALHWSEFGPYFYAYVGLLVVVHLCRSLRWNNLLAPLGVRIPTGPLLAISSVGFMAILALPARLGEFVRPGLIRKRGASASAALGTVAVERIVDGLMISVFVFVAFFAARGPQAPGWMMPTAYVALGGFTTLLVFLVFALRRPLPTVRFCLKLTLLPRFAPRAAAVIEDKVIELIRGFGTLRDPKNLIVFLAWSVVYWGANGVGLWVLARGFHLELSMFAAFATMGLVAIGISLPNSPGLVGQFQWLTLLGLSIYLGPDVADKDSTTVLHATALAFAIVHHGMQVLWYLAMGALGLASPWVSFADLWSSRKEPGEALDGHTPEAGVTTGLDNIDALPEPSAKTGP